MIPGSYRSLKKQATVLTRGFILLHVCSKAPPNIVELCVTLMSNGSETSFSSLFHGMNPALVIPDFFVNKGHSVADWIQAVVSISMPRSSLNCSII